jgi:hypothetical protein
VESVKWESVVVAVLVEAEEEVEGEEEEDVVGERDLVDVEVLVDFDELVVSTGRDHKKNQKQY